MLVILVLQGGFNMYAEHKCKDDVSRRCAGELIPRQLEL